MRGRLATIRRAPRATQRAFCEGLPPPPVTQPLDIIKRADLNVAEGYARWADRFIHLNDELIAYVTQCAPHESARVLLWRWKPNELVADCYYRDIDDFRVWITSETAGGSSTD